MTPRPKRDTASLVQLVLMMLGTLVMTIPARSQTRNLSPNDTGGPQYNQPQPLVVNYLGANLAVAWPQNHEVYYV